MARIIRHETLNCAEYFGLNEQQARVIDAIGSNCVINAGAGTGKTKTLTAAYIDALINNRLDNGGAVTPNNIVAITFTNAAAEELQSRIVAGLISLEREDVAELMGDAWIMTIHAFCNKVLKRERLTIARDFKVDTNFTIIEQSEAKELQYEVAKKIVTTDYVQKNEGSSRGDQLYEQLTQKEIIDTIIALADKARVYDVETTNIIASEKNGQPKLIHEKNAEYVNKRIANLTRSYVCAYQAEKAQQGYLDFSDQILFTKRLFESHPNIAQSYKDQFGVILIDEFQDTNFVQYDIFKLIATDNIVVVGDKRQSIYAFQGATVEVFDEALSISGGHQYREVKLQRNYRSHHQILDTVNRVFEDEALFGDDFVSLEPHEDFQETHEMNDKRRSRTKFIELLPSASNKNISLEAGEQIADEFLRLQNDEGYRPSDMVVLAPTRSQLYDCAKILKARGFNAIVVGGDNLLADKYVGGLFSMLKLIDNALDDAALVEASLSIYGRVIDEELAEAAHIVRKFRKENPKDSLPLWHAYETLAGEHPESSLGFFVNLISSAAARLDRQPLWVIAQYIFSASGVAYSLKNFSGEFESYLAEESFSNVLTFLDLLQHWQKGGMTNRTCFLRCKTAFENEEKFDFGQLPVSFDADVEVKDAIRMMTIHKSKGLEYPVVAVIGQKLGGKPGGDPAGKAHYRISKNNQSSKTIMEISLQQYQLSSGELLEAEGWCTENGIKNVSKIGIKGSTYPLCDYEMMKSEHAERASDEGIRTLYVAMTRAKERLVVVYSGTLPKKEEAIPKATTRMCRAIHEFDLEEDEEVQPNREEVHEGCRKNAPFEFSSLDISQSHSNELVELDECDLEHKKAAERATLIESFKGAPMRSAFVPLDYRIGDFATWPQTSGNVKSSEKLEEITASNIEQFHTCPRQYYFSGIMRIGLLSDTNDAMTRGTAMHTVLEHVANAALINKTSSPEEVFSDEYAHKIQYLYELSADETQKVLSAARKVTKSTWWSELEACDFIKTEAQFYEPLGKETDRYFLHGYIDICGQRADGSWMALDYKSGTREVTSEKFVTQAQCYALALMREGAPSVDITFVRPEVKSSEAEGGIESFTYHFDTSDCPDIEAFIERAKNRMEHSGLIGDEELKDLVKPEHCLQYCPYRGPLCAGVQR